MRMMLRVSIPADAGNQAIKDDSLGKILQSTLEELKPEASFYFADGGKLRSLNSCR